MDALLEVEGRVREGVRALGIDPQRDPEAVREIVDAEVAGLVAEWMHDDVALSAEPTELARHAFHAVAGFGPLQPYFDDPAVEETVDQ